MTPVKIDRSLFLGIPCIRPGTADFSGIKPYPAP
jgi:hypothetical protein